MKRLLGVILTASFITSGCAGGISEKAYNDVKVKNAELQKQLDQANKDKADLKTKQDALQKELEAFKNGPVKLIEEANLHMKNKKYDQAKALLATVLEKHPSSPQVSEAKTMIATINATLNKEAEAKALAIKKAEEAEKKRLATAVQKMRIDRDTLRDVTYYYDKTTPVEWKHNTMAIYISEYKNDFTLQFRIQYAGSKWLETQGIAINTDSKVFKIDTSRHEPRRAVDHGSPEQDVIQGNVYEYKDHDVTKDEFEIIQAAIASKKVTIRFSGYQGDVEFTLTPKEKQALLNVLDAYKALGGKLDFKEKI